MLSSDTSIACGVCERDAKTGARPRLSVNDTIQHPVIIKVNIDSRA